MFRETWILISSVSRNFLALYFLIVYRLIDKKGIDYGRIKKRLL